MILLVPIVLAIVGWAIGASNHKRRGGEGFLLGLLLGPIGWVIVAVLGPSGRARNEAEGLTGRGDELEKLAALEESGILSTEEYMRAKARLFR